MPGKCFWAYIVGRDLVILNPTGYMLDIFRVCFHSLDVISSIDSSKMINNFLEVSNFNQLFSNSTGSSVTNRQFFPSGAPFTLLPIVDLLH